MSSEMVNANPTKEFFVNMLVRDILLKQAIIELIDNSIDGAKGKKKCGDFQGLEICVHFDKRQFSIRDNCGGIPLDVAKDYAFRFGRPKSKEVVETETTGIFGIGMKRALFKMGKYFEVKSATKSSYFEIKLDVEKWMEDDGNNWDFPFEKYQNYINNDVQQIGTEIIVSKLYDEISGEFDALAFEKELIEHVERRVGLDIDNGIQIRINNQLLIGNHIKLVNTDEVKPVKEEYEYNNVKVKILAGVAPKEEKDKYAPENAGWYVYCNGRLIIAADKTSLTTWKDMENKNSGVVFTNSYASFRGSVFFNSNFPERLPWNTTKTGINESSLVYLNAKEKMTEVFKIVKGFIDEVKKNTINNDDGIEETVSQMPAIDLTSRNSNVAVQKNRELSISKIKVTTTPNVTISYKKPRKDVELVKSIIKASSNKEVGEMTFEYFKDAEC